MKSYVLICAGLLSVRSLAAAILAQETSQSLVIPLMSDQQNLRESIELNLLTFEKFCLPDFIQLKKPKSEETWFREQENLVYEFCQMKPRTSGHKVKVLG